MISFRFHVVSITAVFLAIAIGVVVGTTYVDGAVVDVLRNRIDSVNENLDDRKAENDRLESELGLATTYIDASADFAVTDRLTDVPALIVAARGVDEATVTRLGTLARVAGGTTPGIVWLETSWDLEDDEDRAAMASILGADADDPREDLRADAWAGIVAELAAPPEEATPPAEPPAAVLEPLVEAGFLSVDSLDDDTIGLGDLAGTQPRVLLVTGTRAEPAPASLVPVIASAAVGAELVTVVADVHVVAPEAPGRGEEVLALLPPDVLEVVAVVDNADVTEGQVASVLALSAGADGPVGHLGYGDGAVGVLPAWTPT
jgi:Copper transport outer membrane protein, MctB